MTAQKLMLPTAKVNGERSLKDLCRKTRSKFGNGIRIRVITSSESGSDLSLSKCFGLISGLNTKFLRKDGHFCRQLLLKQWS